MVRGLKLFVADIIDEDTGEQELWYVVGRTYDTALKRFIKWANKTYYRYAYYFDKADDYTVKDFVEMNGDVKAGIYD